MIAIKTLLPCPFCDKADNIQTGFIYPNYIIKCYACSVVMSHDRKDKVIEYWNKRVLIDKLNSLNRTIIK